MNERAAFNLFTTMLSNSTTFLQMHREQRNEPSEYIDMVFEITELVPDRKVDGFSHDVAFAIFYGPMMYLKNEVTEEEFSAVTRICSMLLLYGAKNADRILNESDTSDTSDTTEEPTRINLN